MKRPEMTRVRVLSCALMTSLILGLSSSLAGATSPASLVSPGVQSGCPSTACTEVLQQVAAGAKVKSIPSDLTPSLANAAADIKVPPGGTCSSSGVAAFSTYAPCIYPAASSTAPKIVLLGESHAWQWSQSVDAVAQRVGDSFALLFHSSCTTVLTAAALPIDGHEGQAPTGAQCVQWLKAAITWINNYKPQMVIVVASNQFAKQYEPTYLIGLTEVFKRLQSPGRKLVMLGDLPNPPGEIPPPIQDAPECLAAHESSVKSCNLSEPTAVKPILQNGDFAKEQTVVKLVGASFINVIPWFCTKTVCPTIIGKYEVYEDVAHATTTYSLFLSPVLQVALGLTPTAPGG